MNMNFDELTTEQLYQEKSKYQSKIDGTENDGRLTVNSSMYLDHWFDMIGDIENEIERRTA